MIEVVEPLRKKALNLYVSRPDKNWGLIDCASIVVMQEHGTQEAFTNDRHFEQAGLKCLLPKV